MGSLSAHLGKAGDHGRLAFHPECPICCQERLVGTLPRDAVLSRRTQALLSAGVLAIASATPTTALAVQPDQEREGTAAPDQLAAEDPASDPDFDPGGESTDLPVDVGVPEPETAPVSDDVGMLEPDPATDEAAPVVDPGDGSRAPGAGPQAVPPTADLPPAPPTAAVPPAAPPPAALPQPAPSDPEPLPPQPPPSAPPGAPTPEPPSTTPARPDTDPAAYTNTRTRQASDKHRPRSHEPAPSHTVSAVEATQPETVNLPSTMTEPTIAYGTQVQSAASAAATVEHGQPAQRGDRFHVVLAGESLWSIADDVLGDGASVARVAREVNRLWELNRDRIRTGDPDLLLVGTQLVLR